MVEVVYESISGVQGQYFRCPFGVAKLLSTKACAGLYCEAMSPKGLRDGLRIACRSCEVGASHAGVSVTTASSSRFLGTMTCSRCQKQATRLIRKSLCVGCYNREIEFLKGRNAKGGKPIHAKPVAPALIACQVGEEVAMRVRRLDRVTSRIEAVLSVLRLEDKSVSFGWIGASVVKGDT